MTTLNIAPLYRSTIGFDRLFDLIDRAARVEPTASGPAYDIEKVADDAYRITLAVAGFAPDEIDLTQNDTVLLLSGQKKGDEGERQYLHRGLSARTFRQTFNLADHVKVTGATLEHGLLTIELVREVPDALKPRRIPVAPSQISSGRDTNRQLKAA